MSASDVVARHLAAGRFLDARGLTSVVREEGDGPAVVGMHGVPASTFLSRKVLGQLADRGMHAVAFGLPGPRSG